MNQTSPAAPSWRPGRDLRGARLACFVGLLSLLLVATATLSGCDESSAAEALPDASEVAVRFTDDAGRTIELPSPAERVVAGSAFAVELLMALDHPPVLRPDVPERKLHPAAARSIPTLAIEHGAGPDVEAIAAARADLVILHVNFSPFAESISRTLGAPVALLEIRSVEDVSAKLELLGQVTGRETEAGREIKRLGSLVAAAAQPGQTGEPRVLALFGTPDAFYAYRSSSYLGSMLEMLGAKNVAADAPSLGGMRSIAPINLEQAIAGEPEAIVIVPHGPPDAVRGYLASHPAWQQIEAVRSGRVHLLDEALFSSSPGPRAPEALTHLKTLLYPESP